ITEGKATDYSQLDPSRTAAPGEWQWEAPRSAMARTLIRAIHRKPADAHNVEPAINQGTRHGPVVPIPDRLAHPASPMAGPDPAGRRLRRMPGGGGSAGAGHRSAVHPGDAGRQRRARPG